MASGSSPPVVEGEIASPTSDLNATDTTQKRKPVVLHETTSLRIRDGRIGRIEAAANKQTDRNGLPLIPIGRTWQSAPPSPAARPTILRTPPHGPTLPPNSQVKGSQPHEGHHAPTARQRSLIDYSHGKRSSSSMKPQMYRAVTMGSAYDFGRHEDSKLASLTATQLSIWRLVQATASLRNTSSAAAPELAMTRNSSGQLALHLAAAAGHFSAVKSMVAQHLAGAETGGQDFDVMQENDEDGNTPLHLAVKNGHEEVAKFLFDNNPQVSMHPNRHQMSPLSMAAEAGHSQLVTHMLKRAPKEIPVTAPMGGKSLAHAGITGRNIGISISR